jgi:hypothetical protein
MSEIPKVALEVKSVALWAHLGLLWQEATDVVDICHRGSNEIVTLTAERDELLEALKRIAYGLSQDARTADGWTKAEAVACAEAAIAKAELPITSRTETSCRTLPK